MSVTDDDPGMTQPRRNLREVAERAGVAMSSVSRVLTDHPDVSPRMRKRVLAVVDELGYEPNLLAQSLRRGSTLSVGFVIRDISSPLFSEIALGAETELRSHGYSMLLTNSEGLPSLDAATLLFFRGPRIGHRTLTFGNPELLLDAREMRRYTLRQDPRVARQPDLDVRADHFRQRPPRHPRGSRLPVR